MESLEGIGRELVSDSKNLEPSLSKVQLEYVREVASPVTTEALIDRIDELSNDKPPKAIDSNKEIAEAIEPMKDKIPSKYLEAPNDDVQVERASDAMLEIKGCRYEDWKNRTPEERLNTLKSMEVRIAEISHRPSCGIHTKSMPEGHLGYYSPGTKTITLNSNYLKGDYESYKKCLDTVIHEGRHAYQDYNLTRRQVHTSPGDLTNWRLNENKYGYQSAERFGFKLYWMQPVEADARKFAEDVVKKFESKI